MVVGGIVRGAGISSTGNSEVIYLPRCARFMIAYVRFTPECTLEAVMPEPVGRLRGFEGRDVHLCLTVTDHSIVVMIGDAFHSNPKP